MLLRIAFALILLATTASLAHAGFVEVPAPEPSLMALLAAGGAGALGFKAFRRR